MLRPILASLDTTLQVLAPPPSGRAADSARSACTG